MVIRYNGDSDDQNEGAEETIDSVLTDVALLKDFQHHFKEFTVKMNLYFDKSDISKPDKYPTIIKCLYFGEKLNAKINSCVANDTLSQFCVELPSIIQTMEAIIDMFEKEIGVDIEVDEE